VLGATLIDNAGVKMTSSSSCISAVADYPNVTKFGYISYKVSPTTVLANFKKCNAQIKEKLGTTSTFVHHLSTSVHQWL